MKQFGVTSAVQGGGKRRGVLGMMQDGTPTRPLRIPHARLGNAGNCHLCTMGAFAPVGQTKLLRPRACRATAGADAIDAHVGGKAERERVGQREQPASLLAK